MESALDRLLAAVDGVLADLDALDGDGDLEPALGAPENPCMRFNPSIFRDGQLIGWRPPGDQRVWSEGGNVDEREDVSEDEGADTGDDEHSLGWTEHESVHARPGLYPFGFASDDGEPGLSASEGVDQRGWVHPQPAQLRHEDREEQCEDEGGTCEGEGDRDEREPEDFQGVPEYADDGTNQLVIVSDYGPDGAISPLGAR